MALQPTPLPRPAVGSVQEYGRLFTDAGYWRPYVDAVLSRHDMAAPASVVAGLPGAFPVFIVDGQHVVKFFTDLFDGATSFALERQIFELLSRTASMPVPRLLAAGALFSADDGWPWPYIISSVMPGRSLTEDAGAVTADDKGRAAVFLGGVLRRLHGLRFASASALDPTWRSFTRFLEGQHGACAENQRRWQAMPERLIRQIDGYLPAPSALIDSGRPRLLHCDLNADHLLGRLVDGKWQPSGIIDFGDAMAGDRLYDLVALHLGLFHCDKRLLRLFLAAYSPDAEMKQQFTRRAMGFTLLHRFAVLQPIFQSSSIVHEVETLDELATLLWDFDQPGLSTMNQY